MSPSDVIVETERVSTGRPATERCQECDGWVRTRDGETYCTDCGLVVREDRLDRGPDWRRGEDGSRTGPRVGAPLTAARHDRGLSTEIGFDSVDGGRKRRRLHRMRREHARARYASKAERNLADALGQIARITAALDLSYSVRERASRIYRHVQRAGLPAGRSIDTLAAASVYAACRCDGMLRPIGEVAAVAHCTAEELVTGYRLLNRELGLAVPVVEVGAYVSRVLSAVDAPTRVRRRAFELAERAEDAGLGNGRHPGGLAAACVYHADREHGQFLSQQAVADAADVTTRTVRKRWRELREIVD